MKEIKKFLSMALSVSLITSLGMGYKKNCSAMEQEYTTFGATLCNYRNIPIRLEVGPNSSKEEILDALIDLKNYLQIKLLSVNPGNQNATSDLISRDFFTSHYNLNNVAEMIAARVGHDWLDAYYRYSFIRTIRGDVGRDLNFAGYFYTMLRNSGLESYVISIEYRDVKNINNTNNLFVTVVRLGNNWYCIPCELCNKFDNIQTLGEFLCSMFEKGLLFTKIKMQHLFPEGTFSQLNANYDVHSREEAFRTAFEIGNRRFNQVIDSLRERYIPAPIVNVAI